MAEKPIDTDAIPLLSSYGIMTAERILAKFSIHLNQADLMVAIKNVNGFYNYLLRLPYKNILDSIVLQQAYDYYVFAQKLFVDFLLDAEGGKEESAVSITNEEIEGERKELLELSDRFKALTLKHEKIIASSQAALIAYNKTLQKSTEQMAKQGAQLLKQSGISQEKIIKALQHAKVHADFRDHHAFLREVVSALDEKGANEIDQISKPFLQNLDKLLEIIDEYKPKIEEISEELVDFRTTFYNLILRTKALMVTLSSYRIDPEKDAKNKENLFFDTQIGEGEL